MSKPEVSIVRVEMAELGRVAGAVLLALREDTETTDPVRTLACLMVAAAFVQGSCTTQEEFERIVDTAKAALEFLVLRIVPPEGGIM